VRRGKPPRRTRTCVLLVALVSLLAATLAAAAPSIQKVSYQSAVTTLNDGSAAEQAFIFNGLAEGRDLTRWQIGTALRKTLQAAIGPGGHALKVSLAQPPSPQRGIAGVIYIGLSTQKQLDLATYTSRHEELQIIVTHTPVLS
jgi:ABC-type nitrate/sulfonate/bicarbonate transport system substrate-binding protein